MWDLKLKRSVINFTDPSNRSQRNSVVAWSPDVATRVIVASEDDRNPVLQVWDLRNATAPQIELRGHHKGILSASWCPFDSNLLISSGKDNRTILWDPDTAEMLCDLPPAANWTFNVEWSPKMVGLVSCASFDGEASVYSLQDAGGQATVSADGYTSGARDAPSQVVTAALRRALWLWRDARILQREVGDAHKGRDRLDRRQAEQRAAGRVREPRALGYCATKAAASSSDRDAAEWSLMQVLCSQDQRLLLLQYLGLAEAPTSQPPSPRDAMGLPPLPTERPASPGGGMAVGGFGEDEDPSAVFSQLAIAQEEKEAAKAEAEAAAAAKAEKLAAEAEKRAAAQATIAGGGGNGGAMTTSPSSSSS